MKELRLAWEPINRTPLASIEQRMREYKASGLTILENGTLLAIKGGDDHEADARQALNEARFLTDFRTIELQEGGFMVRFHRAVSVFVGAEEFRTQHAEVVARLSELHFPSEYLFVPEDARGDHTLIGLYARGKLQRECYNVKIFTRL